jgi:prepilin-type N-terminal cleavage/methylation domain-containing protein
LWLFNFSNEGGNMKIIKGKFNGFTLIEIIVAVTIFLVIILIFIQVFNSIIKQNKISIEKARMNEYLSLIEKAIKDELNASDLEVDPDTWSTLESQNPIINPKFYPTCVIQPNIFQESIDIHIFPLVYIHPGKKRNNIENTVNTLYALWNTDQAIRVLYIDPNNITSLPLTLFNVVNPDPGKSREVRWYYVLNQNGQGNANYSNIEIGNIITTPQFITDWHPWHYQQQPLIDLSNQVPQYDRRSRYRISVVVSRLRLNNNNIPENIKFLHGTYWQNTPNNRVFDPVNLMIYTSIWLERDNHRRILELKKSFLINLKSKKII